MDLRLAFGLYVTACILLWIVHEHRLAKRAWAWIAARIAMRRMRRVKRIDAPERSWPTQTSGIKHLLLGGRGYIP